MTAADIKLTDLSCATKDKLVSEGAFKTKRDGLPFTDDDPLSDPRDAAITAVTTRCHMFDLNIEEQRTQYADLLSKVHVGDCVELIWEERVKTDKGLVIYITVAELAQIPKNTIKGLAK